MPISIACTRWEQATQLVHEAKVDYAAELANAENARNILVKAVESETRARSLCQPKSKPFTLAEQISEAQELSATYLMDIIETDKMLADQAENSDDDEMYMSGGDIPRRPHRLSRRQPHARQSEYEARFRARAAAAKQKHVPPPAARRSRARSQERSQAQTTTERRAVIAKLMQLIDKGSKAATRAAKKSASAAMHGKSHTRRAPTKATNAKGTAKKSHKPSNSRK